MFSKHYQTVAFKYDPIAKGFIVTWPTTWTNEEVQEFLRMFKSFNWQPENGWAKVYLQHL